MWAATECNLTVPYLITVTAISVSLGLMSVNIKVTAV
jgi:hypothetical protein